MIPVFGTHKIRLQEALAQAIALFEQTFDQPLLAEPELLVTAGRKFHAVMRKTNDRFIAEFSTGVVDALDSLWFDLWETTVLTSGEQFERIQCGKNTVTDYADLSLVWLCLHELMHIQLRHFEIWPHAHLIEVSAIHDLGFVRTPKTISGLPDQDLTLVSKCHEMQADSEATDIFLGLYSETRWEELRLNAACIFVVMAIIERENQKSLPQHETHPTAGTRFFTLLGHLFQMWTYPGATLEPSELGSMVRTLEKPDVARFEAYSKAVITPLINDAVTIAATAQAVSFLVDIGGKGAIFKDIMAVQYADDLKPEGLLTEAAREWLQLMPVNERLMGLAGHRG
ncbi:MAG: hypothetical protein L3J30_12720 [Marinosulfonomonas sp.]|nr:hypothetical protein [Marinosulfonomonas sp.]